MAETLNLGTDGNWATKENSLLGYNSESGNYKPLPFDFTRASNGTFVNKSGLIETAANGVPRIDFLGNTSGALLLEPQSTNILTNSENGSTYTVFSATKTLDEVISPDGTLNSFTLEGNGDYNQVLGETVSVTLPNAGDYTFSVFAKKGTNNFIQLFFNQFSGSSNGEAYFDLENGTTPSSFGKIENYGNGWYRCSVVGTVVGSDLSGKLGFRISYTSSNFFFPTANDANGKNAYFYGFQTEQQSYATSYIPTSGSSVTRNQDVCTNGGSLASINSTSGTLYAEIAALNQTANVSQYITISDGTYNNRASILFSNGSTNSIRTFLRVGGVPQIDVSNAVSDVTDFNKIAFSYKENNFKIYLNGVLVSTDTSGSVWSADTITKLSFSEINTTGGAFFGKTKALAVWKEALSDQELADLTYPTPTFPTFTLDFNTIAEQFTFARGSEATYVDAQGLIQSTASNNAPRLDYSTGAEAFLLEPQSTNLLPYSEDFSQWSSSGDVTVESGYLAPDGTNNAYKVSGTTSALTLSAGLTTTTTRSIYARTVSGTGNAQLLTHNSNTNNLFTITEQWQRFDLNTANATGVNFFYAVDFRGSGTLSEVILWGANATNDQDYATSYIPSNGSQVTRNQETCINATPEINSEEGVLYFEGSALVDATIQRWISLGSGGNANRVSILFNAPSRISCSVRASSSAVYDANFNIGSQTNHTKAAIRYKNNDYSFFVNGVKVNSQLSGTLSFNSPLSELAFDSADGGSKFFGNTKDVQVYTKALSDAELIKLTTI